VASVKPARYPPADVDPVGKLLPYQPSNPKEYQTEGKDPVHMTSTESDRDISVPTRVRFDLHILE
jgi:hypothetical protein